jgi:hypothetical protein
MDEPISKHEVGQAGSLFDLAAFLKKFEQQQECNIKDGAPIRPAFMALVHPDTGITALEDMDNPDKPPMLCPLLVLEMLNGKQGLTEMDSDEWTEENTVSLILQPATAAGLLIRLVQYFQAIGLDPSMGGVELYKAASDAAMEAGRKVRDGEDLGLQDGDDDLWEPEDEDAD